MRHIIIAVLLLSLAACSQKTALHTGHNDSAATTAAKPTKYTCPMHPNVISDKEGICPICQMDLVPVGSAEAESEHEKHTLSELTVTEQSRVLADVQTATVMSEPIRRTVTAIGTLDFAEQNRRSITARVSGRIERLFVNQSGMIIHKGQPLFDIYSPELLQAQNEYIIAFKNQQTTSLSGGAGSSIVTKIKERLMIWGLTEAQVQTLERGQEAALTTTIYAPYGGTVIEKKIVEGTYVNIGAPLFEIADLSTLWNMAELYETDVAAVKIGQQVVLHTQTYPNETFKGRVAFVYPVVNAESRTVKIRIETPNPHGKLRPAMYTETLFVFNQGTGLTVPDDAVLVTGKQNIIWVQVQGKTNEFAMRQVTTGAKFDGKTQILSGVSAGEKVVASGGFLLDSERQLRGGAGGGHQHGGETPQKNSDSMKGMKM